jgi:hypothetical protein
MPYEAPSHCKSSGDTWHRRGNNFFLSLGERASVEATVFVIKAEAIYSTGIYFVIAGLGLGL